MSNYPDDIHDFDDDPRSPFYELEKEDFPCENCEKLALLGHHLCEDCIHEEE